MNIDQIDLDKIDYKNNSNAFILLVVLTSLGKFPRNYRLGLFCFNCLNANTN